MTIYQKAIKVRKYCDNKKSCDGCIYRDNCRKSNKLIYAPIDEKLKDIAEAIHVEKWKVK